MPHDDSSVGLDLNCFTSRDGLFATILFILSLILVILCSASDYWLFAPSLEMAYVSFSSAYSCVTLLFLGLLYICKLYNASICACLPWRILELGNCILSAIFHFIGMAISASVAVKFGRGNRYNLFVACAIFSVIIMGVYIAHAVVIFRSGKVKMARSNNDPRNVPT
uniref:Uncharacterized protein LOC100184402 n=1 Tax=Phallusia mammillata TaxID=59560 RepID=A0A6F9DHH7_9ASCI|nr:uncharacterized protein LOC100184402 [Phallusia mammillata]